jgi:thiamine-phosphate pyrophosphorylase
VRRAPILSLVIDRKAARHPLERAVEAAVRGGVDWVQIRERELEGAQLLSWSAKLADAARRQAGGREVAIFVNRRIDIALSMTADGVHLGFDALAPQDARALFDLSDRSVIVGVSAHHPDELAAAARDGADYAHLAPIFAPRSKRSTRPPLGTRALGEARAYGLPVLAQGGIDASVCREVVAAGAAGVAVTGAILMAADPEAAAAELRQALDGANRGA